MRILGSFNNCIKASWQLEIGGGLRLPLQSSSISFPVSIEALSDAVSTLEIFANTGYG